MQQGKTLYGIIGIAALAVTLAAVGLYVTMSSRGDQAAQAGAMPGGTTAPARAGTAVPPAAVPSIEVAAERLAQRLKANGGTGDEWALLARSYVQMKRYPEAVDAFGKALQKLPGDKALIDEEAAARKSADSAAATK
jgi:cytochrome c-type biogenesis protein CcmH